MIIPVPKVSYEVVDDLARSYELDLIAFFSALQEDVLKLLESGKSPENIIHDIERLFNEQENS